MIVQGDVGMRKSPIRHRVKSHTRKNRPVRSYMRGHGKQKLVIRRKLRLKPTKDPSIQAYLEREGFADVSIVPYINHINRMGFKTIASCSGMRKDHPGEEPTLAYVSIVLPENVAVSDLGGDIFEVAPRNVKDWSYVKRLIKAGHRANWNAELGKYLMFLPTVGFTIPMTDTVGMDAVVKANPVYVKAEEELDAVPSHDTKKFLEVLHKRDRIHEKIWKEHGARQKTDAEIDGAWRKLVQSLSEVKK